MTVCFLVSCEKPYVAPQRAKAFEEKRKDLCVNDENTSFEKSYTMVSSSGRVTKKICGIEKAFFKQETSSQIIFDIGFEYTSLYPHHSVLTVYDAEDKKILYSISEQKTGENTYGFKTRLSVSKDAYFVWNVSSVLYETLEYHFFWEQKFIIDDHKKFDYYGDTEEILLAGTENIVEVDTFWNITLDMDVFWKIDNTQEGLFVFKEGSLFHRVSSYKGFFNGKKVVFYSDLKQDAWNHGGDFSFDYTINRISSSDTNDRKENAFLLTLPSQAFLNLDIASIDDIDWYKFPAKSENGVLRVVVEGKHDFEAEYLLQASVYYHDENTPFFVKPDEQGPGDPYLYGSADPGINPEPSNENAVNYLEMYVPVFKDKDTYVMVEAMHVYDKNVFTNVKRYSDSEKYSFFYQYTSEKDDLDKNVLKNDVMQYPRTSQEETLRGWGLEHSNAVRRLVFNGVACVNKTWGSVAETPFPYTYFSCEGNTRFGFSCSAQMQTRSYRSCGCSGESLLYPQNIQTGVSVEKERTSWSPSSVDVNGVVAVTSSVRDEYVLLDMNVNMNGYTSYYETSMYLNGVSVPGNGNIPLLNPVVNKVFTPTTQSSSLQVSFADTVSGDVYMEIDTKRNANDVVCGNDGNPKKYSDQPFYVLQQQGGGLPCVCCSQEDASCGVVGLRRCVSSCVWSLNSDRKSFPAFSLVANPEKIEGYEGPVSVVMRFSSTVGEKCLGKITTPPAYPVLTTVLFLEKEDSSSGSTITTRVVSNAYLSHVLDQDYYEAFIPSNNINYSSFNISLSTTSNVIEPRMEVMRGNERIYIGPSEGFSDHHPCSPGGTFAARTASCIYNGASKSYVLDPNKDCTYLNSTSNTVRMWVNDFGLNDADPSNAYQFEVKITRGCPLACPLGACGAPEEAGSCR